MRVMAAAVIVGLLVCGASAGEVSFGLDIEFSGASEPAGDKPWLTATFDDGGSPGTVDLTLETTNLSGAEYVGVWMFNVDLDLAGQLGSLQIDFVPAGSEGTFDTPDVYIGENAYKADGDGYFDIKILFSDIDGGMTHRFNVGDKAKYAISGIGSLTADSFDFISKPNGSTSEYRTVAHVKGIGEDSGWITTPEPATLSLLVLGGLALLRRRRRS